MYLCIYSFNSSEELMKHQELNSKVLQIGERDTVKTTGCTPNCHYIKYNINRSIRTAANSSEDRLKLYIYFPESERSVKEETLLFDENALIGNIGGYLGLLLGASALTIYDKILEWISQVLRKFPSEKLSS